MNEVQLELNENGKGAFYILDGLEKIGEMSIGVSGNTLEAYHTGVETKFEGKGYAKKLLSAMVDYARTNKLKVSPLCSYVRAQFQRNPDAYSDLWREESA